VKPRLLSVLACFLALAVSGASSGAFAQASGAPGGLKPDEAEIQSAGSSGVEFVNYEGPQPRIDSLSAIKGIGTDMGRALSGAAGRSGSALRYQVIRAVDPSVKEGLDADIIVLGRDAQVDHIRNLRWIIAGYLVQSWGYSEKDAYTLAVFVTVYNAVHRGDLKYFASKYKPVVQKELSAENAGLALRWSEWPGKTRIVVPLGSGAVKGKLGAVDTGAVSGKEVTEGFRAQPDKGVADRQALVDIKEREAEQKQAEVDKQKADLAAAEKKLAEDKAKAEADRAALEKEKTAAGGAAPGAADQGAAAGGAAAAGAAPTADLATKEAAVKAEEAKVAAAEAEVAAKKEEVAKSEAAVEAKQAEAAGERKDITTDQKAVIAAEVAAKGRSEAAGVFLILVADDPGHLGQIAFIDSDTGAPIRRSRINTLHLRSLAELPDAFAAVSGLEGKPGGAKLVKLDKASLESVAEAKAEMYPESAVLVDGASLYAIVKAADGKYYPARFSTAELKEEARSAVAVMPHTQLGRVGSGIAVQTPSGAFAVLKADSLEKAKDLKP
jgi:hypothetical protein